MSFEDTHRGMCEAMHLNGSEDLICSLHCYKKAQLPQDTDPLLSVPDDNMRAFLLHSSEDPDPVLRNEVFVLGLLPPLLER